MSEEAFHPVRCAFVCPDCGGHHMRWVWAWGGKLANRVAVLDGEGAGHLYAQTGEDAGDVDGVSIPVYRSIHQITMEDLGGFIRSQRQEM